MEDPAATEGWREDGGKAQWKSLLKHSCLLCWSTSKEAADVAERDERVVSKAAEITELENAVAVENLELQEQQSDRRELEETLLELEKHKEKLSQQIKSIRQLCYEESQQILSLQAEEVSRESQVEEYQRELAIARWRLRKLKEQVKGAKRRTEEAGDRTSPLQDSIRQSYQEILQEENTLCSLSGGAVTPESQLDGSTSPADTTEDEPLPMRPWGRSQSLPAYADLIMVANGAPFCNNLADTREEVDNSGSSSPKMDESNPEDVNAEQKEPVVNKLDFYQADPFGHCQIEHDMFNEDLFPKTDSSDGFTSDPFKGSDPFAADILFPEADGAGDEADASLSCAENKASTGTQCFESEFPDEDSDIEISYSQDDPGEVPEEADRALGFKPIQSSSEELGPEPVRGWHQQGQFSVESDPNGYELDLNISPPSDVEEHSPGSLDGEPAKETSVDPGEAADVDTQLRDQATLDLDQNHSLNGNPVEATDRTDSIEDPPTPQNSSDLHSGPESQQTNLVFEMDYGLTSQSSFDPYGFKLSPEHSSHTLVDPNGAELSPVASDQDLSFDPETYSPQEDPLNLYSYETVQDSDPYGFKLSPEEENQEVPGQDLRRFEDKEEEQETFNHSNQEVLDCAPLENREVLGHCSNNNQELLQIVEFVSKENEEFLNLCSPENQEVVEHFRSGKELEPRGNDNQEPLGSCSHGQVELLDPENQEVLDFDSCVNQEVLGSHENRGTLSPGNCENKEMLDFDSHDNQELLDLVKDEVLAETNNNQRVLEPEPEVSPTNTGSDSDVAPEDPQGLQLSVVHSNMSTNQAGSLLEGDLGFVFRSGGYIGCPDVADDLEPLNRRQVSTELVRPVGPVRPPRPSLRAKDKCGSPTQGIDLK
ncbi:uncharacterized protein [Nerophis lumbriciformis]|uniref:uncharacterized protein isoform X2 n=1 Tax=Nerophis lumbriciformis TaxID=546530 RepID=UPI002ADFB710|nr:uncharacterized protein LOC133575843 isoform X2 [Nerophis lumbriciformis]